MCLQMTHGLQSIKPDVSVVLMINILQTKFTQNEIINWRYYLYYLNKVILKYFTALINKKYSKSA